MKPPCARWPAYPWRLPKDLRQYLGHGQAIPCNGRASQFETGLSGVSEEGLEMITGEQVKAARRLLGWTLLKLARETDIDVSTLFYFEGAQLPPKPAVIAAVRRALEHAVEFLEGEPPRLKSAPPK